MRIVKEPISTKGSRVSSAISLAGRFLVLVPLVDCTAVSKKIFSAKERRRLRELARMLKPQGFGVICTYGRRRQGREVHRYRYAASAGQMGQD